MNLSSSAELRAFDAAAQTSSMTAAARQLGIRQPTVSAHISSLERNFRVELFHRRGRKLELTEFGRMLREVTHRIYRGEEQAIALLLGALSEYEGVLKLGAIGPFNIVPMVKRFRDRHPKVRVMVELGDSREILARVMDRQDDAGVLLHAVEDPHVYCLPYRRQPLLVFAPREHPLAHRGPISLADLEGQEFVLREDGSRTRHSFLACLGKAGVSIRSSVIVSSREAVREAVAQGLGLGVVAQTAFVPDSRVIALDIQDMSASTHVHVICLKERLGAPLVGAFLDSARLATPG
jgi:LysR family transcriptional regulator, low CO2-responsive transcriptional regulator